MHTIVFLKGLLEGNWAKGRMDVLMGLLGGYWALGGRNDAFRNNEFPKRPCVDGRFFRHGRHGSCYISLFKFKSFDQFNTPQTASNFRHLLSCGTIVPIFMRILHGKYDINRTQDEGVIEASL